MRSRNEIGLNKTEKTIKAQQGYTLVELIVTLSIFLVIIFFLGSVSSNGMGGNESEFNRECESFLNIILQAQNDAMMDGAQRSIRFFPTRILVSYTKDKINYQVSHFPKTFTITGTYLGSTSGLGLTSNGTVSMGGTMNFQGSFKNGRQLIVQVGHGRIYLSDPK
ncbi:MAG: prepilin-type N-terminal cleavage/methylation domain-containing protein [Eubacteriaceae bacterium]